MGLRLDGGYERLSTEVVSLCRAMHGDIKQLTQMQSLLLKRQSFIIAQKNGCSRNECVFVDGAHEWLHNSFELEKIKSVKRQQPSVEDFLQIPPNIRRPSVGPAGWIVPLNLPKTSEGSLGALIHAVMAS